MQERWKLIQSGVSRKTIRIRGNSLFVSSKLHGRVTNSKFEHAYAGTDTPDLSQPDSPRRLLDPSAIPYTLAHGFCILVTSHVMTQMKPWNLIGSSAYKLIIP